MKQSKITAKEEKSALKDAKRWILLAVVMCAVTVLAFISFLCGNFQEILNENSIYIENTATLTSHRIEDMLENAQTSVTTLAKLYENIPYDEESNLDILREFTEYSTFDYVEYVEYNGINWTVDGQTADVSNREYFIKGMQGETGVEVVRNTLITHETLIVFYTPLHYQGEIVGVLKGEYKSDRIMDVLDETYFGEHTVSYLCEDDGSVIVQSASVDVVENISEFGSDSRLDSTTQAEFTNALENHLSYGYTFEGEKGTTNAYLAQISGTDWCVLQVYPSSVTAQMSANILRGSGLLLLIVVAVFGTYIVIIFVTSRREHKNLEQEKQTMHRIVDGVNRLFARFVVVNLSQDSYYYLADYSQMESSIARNGTYTDFVRYFSERILETEGNIELGDALKKEWLTENVDTDTIRHFEFRIRRDQGERWENVAIICLEEKDGAPTDILLAIQDVTETKEIELHSREVLETALSAAQDANNAKSDFLSRMSHDIRTPMNAIFGMNSIAQLHLDDTERVKDCLEKIRSAGGHLLSMLNEILDFSKIESGRMSLNSAPFSVSACVKGSRDMFRQQMKEKGLVLKIVSEDIVHDRVIGDEQRLQRILVNILSNAVKFTPSGGSITLQVRETKSPVTDSRCYEFCCEDTGIGMDEELCANVFEPFSKAADSRTQKSDGTGLGLPISRSLARMMDGDITVQSTPGKGSRFTVKVVLKQDKAPAAEAEETKSSDAFPRYDGKKVLVVEDNEINAEIAVEFLRMFGIEPDVAHNGQEAVDILLSSEFCGYNLVLMDIQMPVMNGVEAVRVIRSTNREDLNTLPIIAMTANAYQEDMERSFAAGMNAHISKPVSPEKFAAVLKEWL